MSTLVPTQSSDSIVDFVEFVIELFGHDVYSSRRGAAPDEVATVVNACPRPLPRLYLEYLLELGRDAGGFELAFHAPSDIDSLLWLHTTDVADLYPCASDNLFPFALESGDGGWAFDYSGSEDNPAVEPKVARHYDQCLDYYAAKTFRNYLYSEAFCAARFPRSNGPCTCLLVAQRELPMSSIVDAVTRLGFVPYWFSDEYTSNLERDGESLILRVGSITTVAMSAPTKARVADVKAHLLRAFPLTEG